MTPQLAIYVALTCALIATFSFCISLQRTGQVFDGLKPKSERRSFTLVGLVTLGLAWLIHPTASWARATEHAPIKRLVRTFDTSRPVQVTVFLILPAFIMLAEPGNVHAGTVRETAKFLATSILALVTTGTLIGMLLERIESKRE